MMQSHLGNTWLARGEFDTTKSLFDTFVSLRNYPEEFFHATEISHLSSPFLFRDMEKVVTRIREGREKKERIFLFGDYDVDGMTGVAALFLTLKHVGADVICRLPAREEGYGLSKKIIAEAKEKKCSLLITVDCGISNSTEIAFAQDSGIDVVVTDHHSIPEKIPAPFAILHPLLPEESFPEKHLTGSGVAFYLSLAILEKEYGSALQDNMKNQLLELAMLGTIGDLGPLTGQNRLITHLGLQALQKTKHPGLAALLQSTGVSKESLTVETVAFSLAPRLNAPGRLTNPRTALELLLGNEKRTQELEMLNRKRQVLVDEYVGEAESIIAGKREKTASIIVGKKHWPAGVLGLIAGKLAEKYQKPTVVVEKSQQKITGSCRGPEDFDITAVLRALAKNNENMFLGFGGHRVAAGFSLLPEWFSIFSEQFEKHVLEIRGLQASPPTLIYDCPFSGILKREDLEKIETCAPFGEGNPPPIFCFPECKILETRCVGSQKDHLSLKIQIASGQNFSAIFFRQGGLAKYFQTETRKDILAKPEIRTWQGSTSIQFQLIDVKESSQKK